MSSLPEFVGTIHIFFGPYRGNPIGLYLRKEGDSCSISPTMYPWNRVVGVGETANKAAADFDAKWKEGELAAEMYSGPHWEGGIKPEKPKPPPKPATPKPEAATSATPQTESTQAVVSPPSTAASGVSSQPGTSELSGADTSAATPPSAPAPPQDSPASPGQASAPNHEQPAD